MLNQIGKTYSKPLAARHGRGTAWEWHAMCESALSLLGVHGLASHFKVGREGGRMGKYLCLRGRQ